jgi:hypothetical protein
MRDLRGHSIELDGRTAQARRATPATDSFEASCQTGRGTEVHDLLSAGFGLNRRLGHETNIAEGHGLHPVLPLEDPHLVISRIFYYLSGLGEDIPYSIHPLPAIPIHLVLSPSAELYRRLLPALIIERLRNYSSHLEPPLE